MYDMRMRYLAIDFGDKRTGVAMGDDVLRIATPMDVVRTGSAVERERLLMKMIEAEEPDGLVVGVPLGRDGEVGDAAKKIMAYGESIGKRSGVEVHYIDERMTSVVADEQMAMTGLTHKQKKARRDALAAAAILKRFLDQLPG
ncbi:Holliday junction resolvase RuvX [Poriferisphaera corsica]|nr:Holliday junction resolvase RuvX [Poriferisphaera corsica]